MVGERAVVACNSSLFTYNGQCSGAQAPEQALYRPAPHALWYQRGLPHAGHRATERRASDYYARRRHTDHRDHPLRAGQLEPRLQRRRACRPASVKAL